MKKFYEEAVPLFFLMLVTLLTVVTISLSFSSNVAGKVTISQNYQQYTPQYKTSSTNSITNDPSYVDQKALNSYNQTYANWSKYYLTNYDLSIRYPSTWKISTQKYQLDCSVDNFLKGNKDCSGVVYDQIVLTKGTENSPGYMSITFDNKVLHKGCETCTVKYYNINTVNSLSYRLSFFVLDGNVLSLSGVDSISDSTDYTQCFVTGGKSIYKRIPTYTYYSPSNTDKQIEELLLILRSVKQGDGIS